MKLIIQTPQKAMKAFSKQKPLRSDIDNFKKHLISLLDKISIIEKRPTDESEEHLKNDLRDFLRDTYYIDKNAINTKDKKDLVIHLDKTTDSEVGVIIEAKRPNNVNEMVTAENPNKKALHELILYYLDERNKTGNFQLKQLVITNINEWYIIDANYFDKYIYNNTKIKTLYKTKTSDNKTNPWFYEELAKIIATLDIEMPCVYFDIQKYKTILRNEQKEDDKQLSALYKILSAQHILKQATPNDSNSLNERFYKELLHIIGLEEAKEGGKNIIRRKKDNPNPASLIEVAMDSLITNDPPYLQTAEGNTKEERVFNVALELCITWMNRILFLKLMEGQLVNYHQGNQEYKFLNSEKVFDYDELFKLFHQVLALKINDRKVAVKEKYSKVPYLNSSLFDISLLEQQTIKINALDNSLELDLINTSILKESKKQTSKLPTLNYLFQFLDAYDFASEGTDDIKEDKKELINASVLGKIFEKINGYKDGSIFTPAFITMYMCKQSIRLAVVEKFNEALSEKEEKLFDTFDDLKNYTTRQHKTSEILNANQIVNSLRICDPAVGSGHFLVSALNEIISIKADLGILADDKGNSISNYEIEIINDELVITEPNNNDQQFEYTIQNGKPKTKEIQRLQKTLFHEKETIIENCLFGVDINPNSVKICSLRLWIELLKNAYYTEDTNYLELETLPNIDINIKCGNSLLSRFTIDADLSKALKSISYDIESYKRFVHDYKNCKDRDEKKGLLNIIDSIKTNFKTKLTYRDKEAKDFVTAKQKVVKISSEINRLKQWQEKIPKKLSEDLKKANAKLEKMTSQKDEIESNAIYKNAFEWRFEFPEVLDNNGEFLGFDLIIANPPYIQHRELAHLSSNLKSNYKVYSGTADISSYFFEKSIEILKPKGMLSLINSNKFFIAEYGKPLRVFLSDYNFISIINFEQVPVFDEALVSSAIIIISKDKQTESFKYYKFFKEKVSDLDDNSVLQKRISIVSKNQLLENSWIFNNSISNEILNKIKSKGIQLSTIESINIKRGITTGFDGAFIVSDVKSNELVIQESQIKDVIKPLLRGKDINRYTLKYSDLNLLYIPWHFPLQNDDSISKSSDLAEKELKNSYPILYNHLAFFKEQLSNRNKSETGISYEWYALQRCANTYYADFKKDKIIWGLISGNWSFALDNQNHLLTSASFFLTSESIPLKFLLALFNSNLFKYHFVNVGEYTAGGAFVLKKKSIEKFIIPIISEKAQLPFINLVDKIIQQKQQGKDTTNLEKEIDELVYKLYDIKPEEIEIIEGKKMK